MALKNPFAHGTTETIESDSDFIELVEPAILKQVDWTKALERPLTYWAGAQGGGKSTILRLFTPNVLKSIAKREQSDPIRQTMEEIGAVRNGAPQFLGVHTKGTVSYRYIPDLALEEKRQQSLFFALLNSRVVQRFLRAMTAFESSASKDLSNLTFDFQGDIEGLPQDMPRIGNGNELQAWAINVERECLKVIESTSTQDFSHHAFIAQRVCDTKYWRRNGATLPFKTLIMVDDGQEMTPEQRTWLTTACTREREGARTWFAVRLHVLQTPALFYGANADREINVIRIESLWQEKHREHVAFVREIIAKRLLQGSSKKIRNISELLQDKPDYPGLEETVATQTDRLRTKLQESTLMDGETYRQWLQWPEQETDPWNRLLRWRELEIYVARDRNSTSKTPRLAVSAPLPVPNLEEKLVPAVRQAALAMLVEETRRKLPLYFGVDPLVYLGLHNVQLVISACELLYDHALENELRRRPTIGLTAEEQDNLLRRFAESRWKAIQDEYTPGKQMQDLLACFTQRLQVELLKANAPYPPGPVGLGIPIEEFEDLASAGHDLSSNSIAAILHLCLAYNFLNSAPRKHKSQQYQIFWVNPLVLIHAGLPVQGREFQPTTMEQLEGWLTEGFNFTPARGASQARRTRVQKLPSSRGNARIDKFVQETE